MAGKKHHNSDKLETSLGLYVPSVTELLMLNKSTIPFDDSVSDRFVSLPIALFHNHVARDVDIYCLAGEQREPALFASCDLGITTTQLSGLERRGCTKLYISRSDFYRVSTLLLESLEDIVADESFPAEERFSVLQSVICLEVENAFRLTDCNQAVALANSIGKQIAVLVSQGSVSPKQLFSIAEHDTTTFVHCTNVAAYAVLLARSLGINDQKQLQQLGVGAMLHDIGKRSIPQEVLAKPGKLLAKERELIETHPQRGYEELREHGNLNFGQLMMVYQHHEWINGCGYPTAVLGEEIHPWAKLLAVVDVFDAITARRPYNAGMGVNKALRILEVGAGKQFEREAVRCWMSLFQLHFR